MKILAIDSSGQVVSAAVADETSILAEYTMNTKMTHSQTLLPMMEQMLKLSHLSLKEIDAFAIASGPGSFTGLRIGSATVKGLAMAEQKTIVPVPTLDGLAYRNPDYEGLVCPIMDARRKQVYSCIYRHTKKEQQALTEAKALAIDELLDELVQYEESVYMLGDAVPVYRDLIMEKLGSNVFFASPSLSLQNASSVALLGIQYYQQGKRETAETHKPFYLRKSQAERVREENLTKKSAM